MMMLAGGKTVHEYYTGENHHASYGCVRCIITTVYEELMNHPHRRFTFVEIAFFQMWWREQSDVVKSNFQRMVRQGRIHFANAGWSMSDEADVHYEDFINNMKTGHDFLKEAVGYRPTIGWHLDPFGHHSATPALFAQIGFNAWFFGRIDYQDKQRRMRDQELEWIWRPFNDSLGSRAEIFTHSMYNLYISPPGFDFDEYAGKDNPIINDRMMLGYNINPK